MERARKSEKMASVQRTSCSGFQKIFIIVRVARKFRQKPVISDENGTGKQ